jgi:hypothetical protein
VYCVYALRAACAGRLGPTVRIYMICALHARGIFGNACVLCVKIKHPALLPTDLEHQEKHTLLTCRRYKLVAELRKINKEYHHGN